MSNYNPNTPSQQAEMLATIGVSSIEELFKVIPQELKAKSFDIPKGMSEFEMLDKINSLASANSKDITFFIGGSFYDHYIPAAVDHLANRSEFYTAYTPYQPECSQGTLQALYEYQTAICRLTGMEVSNASLYDGATALAEAALMAIRITGRNRLILDDCVNPIYKRVLETYLANHDVELITLEPLNFSLNKEAAIKELNNNSAAIIVQTPNFFGSIDNLKDIAAKAHENGALLINSVYPVSLGLLATPAEMGVDIVVGDGQSLGNPLSFGGPAFGFIATSKKHIRNIPGRVVGETVDKEGRRGFVLTLQAREQHIKRHKATSNICSNQSLCALRGLIFLSLIGKEGFVEMARQNRNRAEYAKSLLSRVKGVSIEDSVPTFNEFVLKLPKSASEVTAALLKKGIAAGVPLGSYYKGMDNYLLVTVTEKRTKKEIELLAEELGRTLV
ncbi:MAG: aminomethyl-transferring glycine dehydrogenase subunit GcvPA [Desulfuromonadales bacterium]|nr:aminomethyl-transferring glycine dehydrogenase subunit GcvPA [Desulfuromonadales bacterium]